jgi:hypothetical protein
MKKYKPKPAFEYFVKWTIVHDGEIKELNLITYAKTFLKGVLKAQKILAGMYHPTQEAKLISIIQGKWMVE